MPTTTRFAQGPLEREMLILLTLTRKLHLNTQGSSHWDGYRHYPYQNGEVFRYYNGALQEDFTGPNASGRLGIQSRFSRSFNPSPFPSASHSLILLGQTLPDEAFAAVAYC